VATFNAFANNPSSPLRLLPHQFAMMDMAGVKVEQHADHYAFTVEQSTHPVVFEDKKPLFLSSCCVSFFLVRWQSLCF
jgi:hypothetical protein